MTRSRAICAPRPARTVAEWKRTRARMSMSDRSAYVEDWARLRGPAQGGDARRMTAARRLAAILAADVVGY